MKKKLLLGLLVVLMVGILAFSVFACQPKDDGKDKGDKDKTDDTNKPVETTLDVKAGPMINDLIASINNTAKVVTNIEDAASVNVELYVDVEIGETTVNVKLNVAGSVDAGTNANNWAIVSANVQGVQVGLFAEKNSAGNEYLYIGQNILNKEVVWSKLSQAENANLLSGTPAEEFTDANENGAYDEGEEYDDANENGAYDGEKFGVVPELFELIASIDANTEAKLNAGIINTNEGILKTIMGAVPLVGGLLFAPIDGVTNVEEIDEITFETDLSSADGYAAKLNIEDLSDVIGGLGPVLDTLLKDDDGNKMDLTFAQPIVDMVVPIILGGQFNLTDFKFTPGTAVPEIQLLVDINSDKTFGGLHLSYEHDVDLDATDSEPAQHVKVAFGLDNISFKATSATKPAEIVSAVADAEELAINLGLDLELEAIAGGYANLDLNIYPNVSILGFGEDGYLDIDFSKLYAEVVLTYGTPIYGENDEITGYEPATATIAQYNADGNEDIILKVTELARILGEGSMPDAYVFNIPVNLQEKFDNWAAPKASVASNAGDEPEKGLVDSIIGIVSGIINMPEGEQLDIVGLIMDIAGKLPTVVDEVTALGAFIDKDTATVNVEGLIAALLADDGLIGESKEPIYIEGKKIVLGEIADQVTTDKVLGTIAGLAGIDVQDIIDLVADFTGATLDPDDAYANMAISATGYAGNGIGATITAVLGADNTTAEISIGLSAAIIENKTEYTSDIFFMEENNYANIGGNVTLVSNNTGKDGAKLLLNVVKQLFNGIVTDEQFELGTFSPIEGIKDYEWVEGVGSEAEPYVLTEGGTYVVEGGVWYKAALTAGSKVIIANNTAINSVVIGDDTEMLADGSVEITVADADGVTFKVNAVEGKIGLVDITVAAAGESFDNPAIGAGTYNFAPWMQMGYGKYFIAVTTEGAATITLSTTGFNLYAAGLCTGYNEMNYMNPMMWDGDPVVGQVGEIDPETNVPTYVTEGTIEVTEAGTYVIGVLYQGMMNNLTVSVAQNG